MNLIMKCLINLFTIVNKINVNLKMMAKTKVMAGRTLAVAEAKVADV